LPIASCFILVILLTLLHLWLSVFWPHFRPTSQDGICKPGRSLSVAPEDPRAAETVTYTGGHSPQSCWPFRVSPACQQWPVNKRFLPAPLPTELPHTIANKNRFCNRKATFSRLFFFLFKCRPFGHHHRPFLVENYLPAGSQSLYARR
jgi:hypothetical protein